MKILAIAPTPYFSDRGCHVQILEGARALAARGHTVRIVAYGHGADPGGPPVERAPRIWGYRKTAAGPSLWKVLADPLLAEAARRACVTFRPDVLHAHLHEGAAVGLFLRRLRGVPLLADLQGSLSAELASHGWRAAGRLIRPAEAWIVRRVDAVCAPSASFGRALVMRWGADPARTFVVGSGVDAVRFAPGPSSPDLRARWGLPDPERVVLYLGLLSRHQGIETLLSAAARVGRRAPDVRFLVMGYPGARGWARAARARGAEGVCRFTGRVDYRAAPAHLRLGRIAVSVKRDATEGNGKMYNYMAAGCAVVASDTPTHREILGDCGVYVPPDDPEALAAAIDALLADAPRREALGQRARARAAALFSWDAVAVRLEAALRAAHAGFARGRRRDSVLFEERHDPVPPSPPGGQAGGAGGDGPCEGARGETQEGSPARPPERPVQQGVGPV